MGDRGNIAVIQRVLRDEKPNQVWLYTHWSGYQIEETLRTALARRQRWTDHSYLTRIIFCELVKGREAEETGYGISTRLQDNEHPVLVCDIPGQRVFKIEEDELNNFQIPANWQPKESWTFEEFIALKPVTT